jgi:hypothetical protein
MGGDDARQLQGSRDVDGEDAGVRIGAPYEAGMHHPWKLQIADVLSLSLYEAGILNAAYTCPHVRHTTICFRLWPHAIVYV